MPDNVIMGSFFRKPLGAFVAVMVVGLIVIAVGMTAFGGTSSRATSGPFSAKPLSPAQFARAGVRICLSFRSLDKAIVANGKARTLREATRFFRRFTPRFDRLTAEVDRLVPPPAAVASFSRQRRHLDAVSRDMDQLDHYAETAQWRRFVLFARSTWHKDLKRLGPPSKLGDLRCGQASHTSA